MFSPFGLWNLNIKMKRLLGITKGSVNPSDLRRELTSLSSRVQRAPSGKKIVQILQTSKPRPCVLHSYPHTLSSFLSPCFSSWLLNFSDSCLYSSSFIQKPRRREAQISPWKYSLHLKLCIYFLGKGDKVLPLYGKNLDISCLYEQERGRYKIIHT